GHPGMYGRVSSFTNWVYDTTGLAPPPQGSLSCAGACGSVAPGGCWCDDVCMDYGDCCADLAAVCE
ncbi:MAG: hypothetical protein AAGC55_02700, partial [Myxococcota bacterium]